MFRRWRLVQDFEPEVEGSEREGDDPDAEHAEDLPATRENLDVWAGVAARP